MKKSFILKKMTKQLEDTPGALKNTLIDWGGSLDLYNKYSIKDKELPALFIVGSEGQISYAFQGWYNDENFDKLEKETNKLIK